MAEFATNPRAPSSDSEDDGNNSGRPGPGLYSLGEEFFPHGGVQALQFGTIGGRRAPANAASIRSVTVGPAPKAERFSPVAMPPPNMKMEHPKPAPPAPQAVAAAPVPMADIPMIDAPPPADEVENEQDHVAIDENAAPKPEDMNVVAEVKPAQVAQNDEVDQAEIEGVRSRVVLDSRGKLLLVVGDWEFHVCKGTLLRKAKSKALAELCGQDVDSPAPRRSHTPGSLSRHDPYQELHRVKLTEPIDPKAFLVALHLAHANHLQAWDIVEHAIDQGKGRKLFSDLLAATHQYDMLDCIPPVAVKWMKKVYDPDLKRFDDLADQFWICWMVGHLPCVKQTMFRMVSTARINSKGDVIGFGASDDQTYSTYPSIKVLQTLDDLTKCRKRVVKKLISFVDAATENLTLSPKSNPSRPGGGYICCAPEEDEVAKFRCDKMLLGSFISEIRAARWEFKDTGGSPERMYKSIATAAENAIEKCRDDNWSHAVDIHADCSPLRAAPWVNLKDLIFAEIDKIAFDKDAFEQRSIAVGFKNAREVKG
ncbi:hypothetical protein B0T16DRAFT_386386 [Cercophora newfieldiana]|uniref:BTB domain-containing protein n=1 Tax=Cercophora newfieldiana TaxID=92897 RepID=A0AA39YUQ0_9PEZI|nr:hypothetical protein B0T16DRAFT_386386 [Cercophora newfieldiana]